VVPSLDKVGVAVPTVSLMQLVCLRFEGEAIAGQSLGPSAAWVRRILPALEHARLRAEDYASISIVVAAVYPQPPEGRMPDLSASDYDPAFETRLRSALDGSAWQAILGVIEVREEWRPVHTPRIDLAVYGALSLIDQTPPSASGIHPP